MFVTHGAYPCRLRLCASPAGAGQPSGMVRAFRLTPTVLWRIGHKPFLAAQKSPGRCRGFWGCWENGRISVPRDGRATPAVVDAHGSKIEISAGTKDTWDRCTSNTTTQTRYREGNVVALQENVIVLKAAGRPAHSGSPMSGLTHHAPRAGRGDASLMRSDERFWVPWGRHEPRGSRDGSL